MKLLDMHAHFLPQAYVAALERHGRLLEDGFPTPAWDAAAHLEMMDRAGICCSLLTISSPHPWFGDRAEAADLARQCNEAAAELQGRYPGRFAFAASLPVPDMDAALIELRYALDTLGAAAVKLPTNAAGSYPGNGDWEPLFAALDRRQAVVILHPTKPGAVPEHCFTGKLLPLFEFLGDSTRCVVNLIASGTLERYPHVRVVVPHCGAFLPNICSRLAGITRLLALQGQGEAVDVERSMGSLYFDIAGDALPAGLAILETLAAPNHILYGSDYPYTPADLVLGKLPAMEEALAVPHRQGIPWANGAKLLGIE